MVVVVVYNALSFVAQRDERKKRTKQSMDPQHMRVLQEHSKQSTRAHIFLVRNARDLNNEGSSYDVVFPTT